MPSVRTRTGVVLLLLLLSSLIGCAQTRGLSQPSAAQLTHALQPGQAVYVELQDGRAFRGTFLRVDHSHLWLQGPQSALQLAVADVRYIDFQATTVRPVGEAALGGVAGLLGVFALVLLVVVLAL